MKPVEIVCHKGANEYAPENTIASTQLCIDWGMDYVEIDVSASNDGVLYLMHGPDVDRTTNGHGCMCDLLSEDIDRLDAGSWFHPRFAGERVPRLEPFLHWVKGKIKVFFDVKAGVELQPIIDLVYDIGLEHECFFWFDTLLSTVRFRKIDQHLPLKVNISKAEHVAFVAKEFGANIIEAGLQSMSQELLDTCRKHGIKVMVNHLKKEPEAFCQILDWGVDMVNVDHGDLFAQIAKKFYTGGK
jgi:glycerophosphoryl diester phosphodiesterase